MAARLNKLHSAEVRAKIQASQLINVLQEHALGEKGELSMTRMKAIEILLRKSIPDLSSVTVTGDEDNPVHVVGSIKLVPLK
jgi:flagellar basal body rod protein FlgF